MAGEAIERELQYDLARTRRPCAFSLYIRKAFEEAADVEQQTCEFRTDGIKRVVHALTRRDHCVGEYRFAFAALAA